ncbi:hypothetical protein HanRHA438_Chr01g0027761 [Helianthus annuus]|nr:hypothetical protein HanRHA438_Chr01g0027761 [Helianthus annuus]
MTESRTGRLAVTRIDDQRYLEILDFISTHVSRYWMSEAICGIEMAKVQVCRAVDVAWVMQNLMCLVITSSLWVRLTYSFGSSKFICIREMPNEVYKHIVAGLIKRKKIYSTEITEPILSFMW